MHAPARVLQSSQTGSQVDAHFTKHRFHSLRQTLGFIAHMNDVTPYQPERMHLVSDYAAERIFRDGVSREEVICELDSLKEIWQSFDIFFLEISSYREYIATLDGAEIIVNNFADRDQQNNAEALTRQVLSGASVPCLPISFFTSREDEMIAAMSTIKNALGRRKLIWVSHMRHPGDNPLYEHPNAVRWRVAEALRKGSEHLGDEFFDPTTVAAEMGPEVFFQKDGTDIDHLTNNAAKSLAHIYQDMVVSTTTNPNCMDRTSRELPGLAHSERIEGTRSC